MRDEETDKAQIIKHIGRLTKLYIKESQCTSLPHMKSILFYDTASSDSCDGKASRDCRWMVFVFQCINMQNLNMVKVSQGVRKIT